MSLRGDKQGGEVIPVGLAGGARYNEGKPKLSMMYDAPHALEGFVRVMEFGAQKYTRGNWKKGLDHTSIVDSMTRHVSAWMSGEDIDPESGLPHVEHIACNAMFLVEMVHIHPELDDRVSG